MGLRKPAISPTPPPGESEGSARRRDRISLPEIGVRLALARATARRLIEREVIPVHRTDPAGQALDELTAAAIRVEQGNASRIRRLAQAWQGRAMNYYDLIPEIHFASGFYARGLSGLRLYVGEMQDDGTIEASTNEAAIALLERVRDRAGGRETLLSDYGRLTFLIGECFLIWQETEHGELWDIVSPDELRVDVQKGQYLRILAPPLEPETLYAAPDDQPEPATAEVIPYRLWTPHPRFSGWADSPMRACLDLCEELVLLTLVVRARVMSRLAGNGLLLIPDEMSPPADAENEDAPGDENLLADPFAADLIEATVAPIENPGTAAAQVPLIVRGPQAALEGIRHLTFRDVEEEYRETGLRDECIRRIAMGLDMPPEALLGMSESNHWNAWIVDEQTWKVHLKPIATQFCGNLTEAYLRPTAEAERIEGWERLVVMFDEASIVVNPDRGKDAKDAYDRRVIGKAALREALGFTEDEAPTEEDLAEMLAVEGVSDANEEADETTVADSEDRPPEGEDTPRQEPDEDESQVASAAAERVALERSILAAAQLAVIRCREMAGARLLTKLQGAEGGTVDPKLREARKDQIAHLAGPVFGPASGLVEDGAQTFVSMLIEQWNVEPKVATTIGDLVELHAARCLFDETPKPVPTGILTPLRR